MPKVATTFAIPRGVIVADQAAFQKKIVEFVTSGTKDLHAIFDFDRTLTTKRVGSRQEVTTWQILREHLPQEGQVAYQKLFEKYRALEISGDLTQQDAVDWWSATLDLFVEYEVNLASVESIFIERANMRAGTAELFKLLADTVFRQ